MSIKLKEFIAKIKDTAVTLGDDVLNITFKPGFYTPAARARIDAADDPMAEQVVIMAEAITKWDFVDEQGIPIPIIEEKKYSDKTAKDVEEISIVDQGGISRYVNIRNIGKKALSVSFNNGFTWQSLNPHEGVVENTRTPRFLVKSPYPFTDYEYIISTCNALAGLGCPIINAIFSKMIEDSRPN
jgi:hypothetical protein